jgi:2'-5' RNA ligase
MGYAVELYFDSQTEKSIWDLRHALIAEGISSTISGLGDRPHVSLAVFAEADPDRLISTSKELADMTEAFDFQLSAIGTFPTEQNVLFLSPVLTSKLLGLHRDFHDRLAEGQLTPSAYYIPGNWIPHCSVEMEIPDEQFSKALELCRKDFKPLHGRFEEIGIVEFRPIKQLAAWPLAESSPPDQPPAM